MARSREIHSRKVRQNRFQCSPCRSCESSLDFLRQKRQNDIPQPIYHLEMDLGKRELPQDEESSLKFRNCIGMRFALLEAKLAIGKALRVVEIQKCEETEVNHR